MCDYCGCRELAPIQELSNEHERIQAAAAQLRRAVATSDHETAACWLSCLQSILRTHLAREELGAFSRIARHRDLAPYLDDLLGDHARARTELLALSPGERGWDAAVQTALDALGAHIDLEEHDLFPAMSVLLDATDWAEIALAHTRLPSS